MSTITTSPWAVRATTGQALADAVNPAALAGLHEVEATFEDHPVYAWPDGTGGVHAVIENVLLGPVWAQERSWLGFTINYLYPDADTYPHYVRADLAHANGTALVVPFHPGHVFQDLPAIMVSRSSPRRVTGLATAARKALSVISFIQNPSAVVAS